MREYWFGDRAPLWFSVATVAALVVAAFAAAELSLSTPAAIGLAFVVILAVQTVLSIARPAVRNGLGLVVGAATVAFGIWGLATADSAFFSAVVVVLGLGLLAASVAFALRNRR